MALDIKPMNDSLGAELHNVDLSALNDAMLQIIDQALLEHQVIFFRNQEISHQNHLDFARHWGAVQTHPAYPTVEGFPEITILENDPENEPKIEQWHTDITFKQKPPLGSVLRAMVVPPKGGNTEFLSMIAAYEALPQSMQKDLAGLKAMHSFEFGFKESLAEPGGRERLGQAVLDNPPVKHPVVRTHPKSGRQSLFVNSLFTTHIEGLSHKESRALLDLLFEHLEKPEFRISFQWKLGSIAFWDNRCTQHRPINDYWPAHRRMERITIKGDRPFYNAG
jgi:taurine dioxygenase